MSEHHLKLKHYWFVEPWRIRAVFVCECGCGAYQDFEVAGKDVSPEMLVGQVHERLEELHHDPRPA